MKKCKERTGYFQSEDSAYFEEKQEGGWYRDGAYNGAYGVTGKVLYFWLEC